MEYRELVTNLYYLANELDLNGLAKEASSVDNIIKNVFKVINKTEEEQISRIK